MCYIYILAWELIGLIFVECTISIHLRGEQKNFVCEERKIDTLKRDVTENFFFNEILNLLRIDEKNLNLIFGKIVIGFERIENDPINYLNSKTLKRPRYLYESLISIRNIR